MVDGQPGFVEIHVSLCKMKLSTQDKQDMVDKVIVQVLQELGHD